MPTMITSVNHTSAATMQLSIPRYVFSLWLHACTWLKAYLQDVESLQDTYALIAQGFMLLLSHSLFLFLQCLSLARLQLVAALRKQSLTLYLPRYLRLP